MVCPAYQQECLTLALYGAGLKLSYSALVVLILALQLLESCLQPGTASSVICIIESLNPASPQLTKKMPK